MFEKYKMSLFIDEVSCQIYLKFQKLEPKVLNPYRNLQFISILLQDISNSRSWNCLQYVLRHSFYISSCI